MSSSKITPLPQVAVLAPGIRNSYIQFASNMIAPCPLQMANTTALSSTTSCTLAFVDAISCILHANELALSGADV